MLYYIYIGGLVARGPSYSLASIYCSCHIFKNRARAEETGGQPVSVAESEPSGAGAKMSKFVIFTVLDTAF